METISNLMKIKAIMEYYSLNQSEMAAKMGIHQANLSEILREKRACGPGIMTKLQITFPEINTKWLYQEGNNNEPMILPNHPTISGDISIGDVNNSSISNVGHGNTYNVPACNHPHRECQCAIYPMLPDHVVRALDTNVEEWKKQNPGQCKMIDLRELIGEISHVQKMIGRVMEPDIPEGTLLFLRELNQWDEAMLDGSIYGVDIARPHMVVRRVFDDGDHIRCEPVNPIFGTVRIPKEKVMNLYKIAYGLKKFD